MRSEGVRSSLVERNLDSAKSKCRAGSRTQFSTSSEVTSFGCVESRQRGSHLRIECGQCVTTVSVHAGEDIGPGLLRRIERDLESCLGRDS